MKLKKIGQEQDYSYKWRFYWVITWKFLFSGGNKNLVGESTGGNEQVFG